MAIRGKQAIFGALYDVTKQYINGNDSLYTIGYKDAYAHIVKTLGLRREYRQWCIKNGNYTMSVSNLDDFCKQNDLYTMGTPADYNRLISAVQGQRITPRDVANDIYDHSRYLDGMTALDLYYQLLDNQVVIITY